MLCAELVRTCTHEKVAEAAVLSIGNEFRDRVSLLARVSAQTPGAYVAELVRRFSEDAAESDWEALALAIAGRDMPILHGLRWIVESAINFDGDRQARDAGRLSARGGRWSNKRSMVECRP